MTMEKETEVMQPQVKECLTATRNGRRPGTGSPRGLEGSWARGGSEALPGFAYLESRTVREYTSDVLSH